MSERTMSHVTHFATLADPGALIDEYVPQMVDLMNRPHHGYDEQWWSLRDQVDASFAAHGWVTRAGWCSICSSRSLSGSA